MPARVRSAPLVVPIGTIGTSGQLRVGLPFVEDRGAMQDRRNINPGRDRNLWNEPPTRRGRRLIVLIGTPLLVTILGGASVLASDRHLSLDLSFAAPRFVTVASPTPRPHVTLTVTTSPRATEPAKKSARHGTTVADR